MSSPCLSPPSEGEIVESDLEKATTATVSRKGSSVDRSFRARLSVSRSPSPIRSPVRQKTRTDSRSPYREAWGAKRLVDDDHYDRSRNDPRRFKVRYEDHPQGSRSQVNKPYYDSNRSYGLDRDFRYEESDASARLPDKRATIRSWPPMQDRSRREGVYGHQGGEEPERRWPEQGDKGDKESRSRLSTEQSVSDRGHSPVAAAKLKRDAETRINQIQRINTSVGELGNLSSEYVSSAIGAQLADSKNDSAVQKGIIEDKITHPTSGHSTDEATLIEDRRKRREAIKARHRGQATPLLVRSLALHTTSVPTTPESTTVPEDIPAQGKSCCYPLIATANT